jgi:hypothetical protein
VPTGVGSGYPVQLDRVERITVRRHTLLRGEAEVA